MSWNINSVFLCRPTIFGPPAPIGGIALFPPLWLICLIQQINSLLSPPCLPACWSLLYSSQATLITVILSPFSSDEFIQYEGADTSLVGFWGLRFAVGGRRCVDRLLAADGGGNRPAAEPDHWGQDGAALWPLEGLLCGWLVTVPQYKINYIYINSV